MPLVEEFAKHDLATVLLMGMAGHGKSTLAMQAPPPIAVLCADKPIPAMLPASMPGYNPKQIYYKSYPPPNVNLSDDKHGRPRNVADQLLADIMALKTAFLKQTPLKMVMFDGKVEEWPLPRSLLIEGADFIAKHFENLVCARAGFNGPADFANPIAELWGARLIELDNFYNTITYFPQAHLCNVIVTTGLNEESKMQKNEKGKQESVRTGIVDPDLGGKMNTQGPRKFAYSLLCNYEPIVKKFFVHTKPDAKFRGIRAGRFGLDPKVDATIDEHKPLNMWNTLFGGKV
jgi:hypothetical protein